MGETPGKAAREQRLAAQLRENLRRRKAQSRALAGSPAPCPEAGHEAEASGTLPKTPPRG